jgi:hypothetical protein
MDYGSEDDEPMDKKSIEHFLGLMNSMKISKPEISKDDQEFLALMDSMNPNKTKKLTKDEILKILKEELYETDENGNLVTETVSFYPLLETSPNKVILRPEFEIVGDILDHIEIFNWISQGKYELMNPEILEMKKLLNVMNPKEIALSYLIDWYKGLFLKTVEETTGEQLDEIGIKFIELANIYENWAKETENKFDILVDLIKSFAKRKGLYIKKAPKLGWKDNLKLIYKNNTIKLDESILIKAESVLKMMLSNDLSDLIHKLKYIFGEYNTAMNTAMNNTSNGNSFLKSFFNDISSAQEMLKNKEEADLKTLELLKNRIHETLENAKFKPKNLDVNKIKSLLTLISNILDRHIILKRGY